MDNNNCVLCLENVIGTEYIEYNHCGKYYLHSHCYDELLLNFKNQCIICRKKIRYINEKFETIEDIEEEDIEEFNLVNENNELFNSSQLALVNQTNKIIFKKIAKSLCTGTIILMNFYIVFNIIHIIQII